MKKRAFFLLALLLALTLSLSTGVAADIAHARLVRVVMDPYQPVATVTLRATDSLGGEIRTGTDSFSFVAINGEEGVLLPAVAPDKISRGHIIVVDTSLYYFGNKNVTAEHIRQIIQAYLNKLGSDELVKFLLVGANGAQEINYMSLSAAKSYVEGIALLDQDSAMMYSAIYNAFVMAKNPGENDPQINSIFVVADPNTSTNKDSEQQLENAINLRNDGDTGFDVFVALPYRTNYMIGDNAPKARVDAINQGLAIYESFASRCDGAFCRVSQTNNTLDTKDLDARVIERRASLTTLQLDLLPLAEVLSPDGDQVQNVDVVIADRNGNALSTMHLTMDTNLLPMPTPTPEPEPENTPEPAETPVVFPKQDDMNSRKAIYALRNLWYLGENSSSGEFDDECWFAYMRFCEINNIDPADGIYTEAFELLTQGDPIPAPTATPTPTPEPESTPVPAATVPAQGYSLGDADTQDSGEFIYAMQVVLQNLNCYGEERPVSGTLDEATMNAIQRYCETYGWVNDSPSGVNARLVNDILNVGPSRSPYTVPELSTREKVLASLQGTLFTVGHFSVARWMAALAALVLLCLAVVLAIVLSGKRDAKSEQASVPRQTDLPGNTPRTTAASAVPSTASVPMKSSVPLSGKAPVAGEETFVAPPACPITLRVTYHGRTETINGTLHGDNLFLIGRISIKAGNTWDLGLSAEDRSVSRPHAGLYLEQGQLFICDMGSTNGTTVGGKRLFVGPGQKTEQEYKAAGCLLHEGDEIRIGEHLITVSK